MGRLKSLAPAVAVGLLAGGAAAVGAAVQGGSAARPTADAKASPKPAARTDGAAAHLPGWNADRNAYFGDLHVHTYLSNDAYISGVRRSPDDAYRFAQGEAIGHASGQTVRLEGGPLDFAAVTDHSEYLSAVREAARPGSALYDLPFSKSLFGTDPVSSQQAFSNFVEGSAAGTLPAQFKDPSIASRGWQEEQEAAARHNHPGRFTTFVAYEFTSAPDGKNMHRNVIFGTDKVPQAPFSTTVSKDPEDLWRTMDGWRAKGIDVLAIPHNGNGSDGAMYAVRLNGKPIDRIYAELRARNEPLTEITQIKGTSETHPTLSPNDEWADFEIMEKYIGQDKPVTKFAGGYVRRALEDGILYRDKLGVNPFKLGVIGSSDNHNASPGAVEERNYFGASGTRDGTPEVRASIPMKGAATWEGSSGVALVKQTRGASGLAGVWAEENSRAAIYAALKRKETFATSGPRIKVRFFAGYDFPADLLTRPDTVRQAYAHGVPMGGDLLPAKGRSPKFLVWALRDPRSGYLQRAQIVKGWIENGAAKEQVIDVACSDGGRPDAKAMRCPDNGAGVNLKTCEPDRFKGDVELRTVWTDPNFNPKQRAFYYVRILENPTCRWSTWDAVRNGTPPNSKIAATVIERAWSSPIWFDPQG